MLSAQGGVEIEDVAAKDPDAIAKICTSTRSRGSPRRRAASGCEAAKLNPAATDGAVDILIKLYSAYTEGDADLVRDQPADPHARRPGARARRQGHASTTTRCSATPTTRPYDATQVRDEREQAAHDKGLQYVGLDGYGRHHRQRRRARDEHGRHRQPGRRPARQLPRHRRRRQRRRDGRRARGHQQRPEGAVDLHQHLRRHHQGRGGRQRHRRGARAGADRRADRDPPRRHERRRGPRDPQPITCPRSCRSNPPCSTRPARVVELAQA